MARFTCLLVCMFVMLTVSSLIHTTVLASPTPPVLNAPVATFSGDQSGGVISGIDFSCPPYTILEVNNLTSSILPDPDKSGVLMYYKGPNGGNGTSYPVSGSSGGHGTPGLDVSVNVDLDAGFYLASQGENSLGISAQSIGGNGGDGGDGWGALLTPGLGGNGGYGRDGGQVTLTGNASINTSGNYAHGLFALSQAGDGGDGGGGYTGIYVEGGDGGHGGNGKLVTLDFYGSIVTDGFNSQAIFAQSLGGQGGSGGAGGGLFGGGGPGSGSGVGGNIVLNNAGFLATLKDESRGIFAQSIGGFAGGGGGGGGILFWGGDSASSGDGGDITINNDGLILTFGNLCDAIIAQSIGGGGGNAGDTGALIYTLGGGGGSGGHGGAINLSNTNKLETNGYDSVGILAQSVGGGGGIGAGVGGLAAIGGSGADSSNGGIVTIQNTGVIITHQDDSEAITAQSVGGGGGRARNSGGIGVVGGSGGGGGDGNIVEVTNAATLQTYGNNSIGIVAQSIGAGGGSGAGVGGLIATGGNGDNTGNGSNVTVNNSGNITTTGESSGSIIAQSIGGGGGINGGRGGGAYSILFSKGGSSGSGGHGYPVMVNNTGELSTSKMDSPCIFAQSIGGGGGAGGGAYDVAFGFAATIGGNSTFGGNGNQIDVYSSENAISTDGDMSHGIHAESIGGGGGSGGNTLSIVAGVQFSANIAIGGQGGGGGNGGNINIENSSKVSTSGEQSHGLYGESIGGGGGSGGNAVGWTATFGGIENTPGISVSVSMGGTGGQGGNGQSVSIANDGDIDTGNYRSYGILAQSIGGGGGDGGNTLNGNLTFESISASIALGGRGNKAGNGNFVEVSNSGTINTQGEHAYGILAQSVGGGGGAGGNATSISADIPSMQSLWEILIPNIAISSSIGGRGGGGGTGGEVLVTSAGQIETQGIFAHGILAQSIGGGGGAAGDSMDIEIPIIPDPQDILEFASSITMGTSVSLGSTGGYGGNANYVSVNNENSITTNEDFSNGILAQSIGGGGGTNGTSIKDISGLIDFGNSNIVLKNTTYGNGNSYPAIVVNNSQITTHGNFAHGILAQSIGGGGGFGGISEDQLAGSLNLVGHVHGIAVENTGFGVAYAGSFGGYGSGGDVWVTHTDTIITTGNQSHGIFAQSVAGLGYAGSVNIMVNSDITAEGVDSHAILAQSIGEGGRGDISITIDDGIIQGGSGNGNGIYINGGYMNTVNNSGTILALSGIAIRAEDGNDTIINNGVINGDILLGWGNDTVINNPQAVLAPKSLIYLGPGKFLSNAGILSPGGPGVISDVQINGNLMQLDTGVLEIDVAGFTPGLYDTIDITDMLIAQNESDDSTLIPSGSVHFILSPDLDIASLIAPGQSKIIDFLNFGIEDEIPLMPFTVSGGIKGFKYRLIEQESHVICLKATNMIPCLTRNAVVGDFNCDDHVNLADLVTLGENYNQPGDFTMGDTNADGLIDLWDLVTLGEHYNTSVPAPEPASLVLLLLGGLLTFRRR